MVVFDFLKSKYSSESARSKEILKNVGVSIFTKLISICCSLIIVPLTIDYLNPTRYGIWLSISSVVGWFTFFNFGLNHGFRNKFAESLAKNDRPLAQQYVSTAYFALGVLSVAIMIVGLLSNHFIDWARILKVDDSYSAELSGVFAVLIAFFCLSLVAKTFTQMLTADQKPGVASVVDLLGQMLSLLAVYIITLSSDGNMTKLALYYAGVPAIVILVVSIFVFRFSRYRVYRPSISDIRLSLVKEILGLGWQFFAIDICLLVIFQMSNIVLSREIGPDSVTQYNIAFKYFNILYMAAIIVLTPFWSAFTDAHVKKDYTWMKLSLKRLEQFCLLALVAGVSMLALSGWFFGLWIGDSVNVPFLLSLVMMIYIIIQITATVYMYLINGIGTIRVQLIAYLCFMVISLPILIFSCRKIGVYGVVISPTLIYIIQAIVGKIQINKLLNNTATGIWAK